MIFSRGGGRHAADDPRRSGRHSAEPPSEARTDKIDALDADEFDRDDIDGIDDLDGVDGDAGDGSGGRHGAFNGPYDISDAPVGQIRVDLGSLQIPSIEGVEVRVQATEGVIQQVVLAHGASALQLGAFAAPRTEGIWDEVRAEIRKSLFNDGVAAEEVPGEFGTELRARVRAADGMMDLRFIGIDGPRWMLRAVYQGAAATDPTVAGPLALCLRGLVVDRGRDAMPVRDALPLRLPREMADQIEAAAANTATGPDSTPAAPLADAHPTDVYGRGSTGISGPNTGSRRGSGTQPRSAHGRAVADENQVNGTSINNGTGGGTASGSRSGGDAAPRRRPSPRPRRSE